MISPITKNDLVEKVESIPTQTIIELYKDELGIDVSKYFKGLNSIDIFECTSTKYRFYYPFNIFGDGEFYDQLQNKSSGYYVPWRWEHNQVFEKISSQAHVLEIGCGSGYFLKKLSDKGCTCFGLELSEDAYNKARDKGLQLKKQLLEEHAAEILEAKYDVICSFQVLEHITDINSYFEHALKLLKKGGKLIIAVPNNNPYIFKHDVLHTLNLPPHHAGLWNKNSLKNLTSIYPISISEIFVEPLQEYKEWFLVQKKYYNSIQSPLRFVLNILPRPLYKVLLKITASKIEGRNVIAIFTKN